MTDTNHTDSVEKVVEHLELLLNMEDMLLTEKAEDYLRETLTTLQATPSQQVEEAVRKERERIASDLVSYQHESGNSHIDIEWFAEALLTPNHQD